MLYRLCVTCLWIEVVCVYQDWGKGKCDFVGHSAAPPLADAAYCAPREVRINPTEGHKGKHKHHWQTRFPMSG